MKVLKLLITELLILLDITSLRMQYQFLEFILEFI